LLESVDIARVIVAFIITLFLIFAVYYAIIRYGKNIPSINQKGEIKIKEIKYLGKGKSLVLVEVKDKEFLLAFSEEKIFLIEKWTKENKDKDLETN